MNDEREITRCIKRLILQLKNEHCSIFLEGFSDKFKLILTEVYTTLRCCVYIDTCIITLLPFFIEMLQYDWL